MVLHKILHCVTLRDYLISIQVSMLKTALIFVVKKLNLPDKVPEAGGKTLTINQ